MRINIIRDKAAAAIKNCELAPRGCIIIKTRANPSKTVNPPRIFLIMTLTSICNQRLIRQVCADYYALPFVNLKINLRLPVNTRHSDERFILMTKIFAKIAICNKFRQK
jgi:hypothetical protein